VKLIKKIAPWLITVVALYFAFSKVDWPVLLSHWREISLFPALVAVFLTCLSYVLRAERWQHLFPSRKVSYFAAYRVLILGFFMNNVLPARAGEFVRAHFGARELHEKRTLVLATIASERLADGVTLSFLFIAFAFGLADSETSSRFLYVAYLFGAAAIIIALLLLFRKYVYQLLDQLHARLNNKASLFAADRIRVFLDGLAPLYSRHRLPILLFWSIVIWTVELFVYVFICNAFSAELNISQSVLFMVAVNFASLVPAAPGGIGVIEAIATSVLMSLGIPKEHALSMVIMQHAVQYLVVGIPGILVMLKLKTSLRQIEQLQEQQAEAN